MIYRKKQKTNAYFKRFEVTEDGISRRVIPGMKNGIHHVTGVEHDEIGRPSEGSSKPQSQMDKRMRKLKIFASIHRFIEMHLMKKQIY